MPLAPKVSRRYDEKLWKELLGMGRKSKEQNLKKAGF